MGNILLLAVWLACGLIDYGLMFAYYQNKYPELAERDRWHDRGVSILSGLAGPCSLVSTLLSFNRGQYGFKL